MQLIRYEAARRALAECHTVDEAKDIADKAAAMAAYARQAKDPEMEQWLAEIRLRAQRRAGEISKTLEKSKGGRPNEKETLPTTGKSKSAVLSEAGISTSAANRFEQLAEVPEEEFEAALAEAKEAGKPVTVDDVVKNVKRKQRAKERHENLQEISQANEPLAADRRYPIIYADPPWRYEHPPIGASNRSIENQYPTMTLKEICALPVADLATEHAMLYLWATSPKLPECFEVIKAWGFTYRTSFVWVKDKWGMGYYCRNQHELLLVCKRGDMPTPEAGGHISSVIQAPRTEHSVKPERAYEILEECWPDLPKLELFCRQPREGWAAWGNQAHAA